ncbi:MAG: preprotein translocase subunit YajC [Acidobacteria bacterium 13_1_20CM_2_55_15]|nr:MAG: preprotein translocase subunit YajC [Acidobacteria bacterium 13_1_40CM_56_16]OLD70878.1 MAG: preprotein translocase subunit YajC [Acidobacteria bacterium 13_1_40CM_2_56_11]OLE89638.1 MAG: preprotein translocase subunit YajC [Acidobacteria bacterium 13_1_20CM_2_55_15]PYS07919.1 MAG: preprotein translocase subunit YajC [Acidobacteriota bacterium]
MNTVLFQQQTQAPGGIISFLPLILILGIFYLIVFLPARRRQKKLQMMIDNLKAGDKVITSGGIYGTIVGFKDDRIQLRVAENVKIELSRSAVTALQGSEQE